MWNGVYHMNMKTSPNDVSNQEILEAMSVFATHVDSRMDKMATKEDLQNLQSEFSKLKATVVTKGYLDDKLADHHADLARIMRKEDEKVIAMMKGK